jgi:hypothetical protein
MQDRKAIRVLNRLGARELTAEEAQQVAGGLPVHTNVCTFDPVTASLDGDGCGH